MHELTDLSTLAVGFLVALAWVPAALHYGTVALIYVSSRGRHRRTGGNTTVTVGRA